jgi:hypothetical protein
MSASGELKAKKQAARQRRPAIGWPVFLIARRRQFMLD